MCTFGRLLVYTLVLAGGPACLAHGAPEAASVFTEQRARQDLHHHQHAAPHHQSPPPCAECPLGGECVARVQCPALVRGPPQASVECHMRGTRLRGVCCLTGSAHSDKSEQRSSKPANVAETRAAHGQARRRLQDWLAREHQLLGRASTVLLNISAPSYRHHLSAITYDSRVHELGRGGLLNMFAAQEMKARQVLTEEELQLGGTGYTDGPYCPPRPQCTTPRARYRAPSGECSGAEPTWGAVNSAYERLLPPHYSDGVWAMRVSSSGAPLVSARMVSGSLHPDADHPSATHNMMFMQLGQFIAHDTSSGVIFTIGNGSAISCCMGDGVDFLPPELQHGACAPVPVGREDAFYQPFNHQCLNFVRAQLAPSPDCSVGYAKQMNGATHYLDLSNIYGSTSTKMSSMRGQGGLLNTFMDYGRELPPLTTKGDCQIQKDGAACFESGDSHGNEVISLTVLHTIWTREHNRIARVLSRLNPDWSEDTVFLEARKITQAEHQHIVYNEWLPLLLGPQLMAAFGLSSSSGYASGYDRRVNPSLTSEFAVAALRFGHSAVDGKIMVSKGHSGAVYEMISLPEVMMEPSRLRLRHFLDRVLVGMGSQPMQCVDPLLSESLTRYLFHGGQPFGLDLAAINIQRGRDHGLPPYNQYRRLCGLPAFTSFQQFPPSAGDRLAAVYESPEDVDLWVGGLLEEPVDGALVGATFANIIAEQFSRSKRGDVYFYEYGPSVNPGAFTPSQLPEIKKVTMSRIICDNSDHIELHSQPPHAFLRADLIGNEPVPCDSQLIPAVDLNRFKVFT